MRIRENGASIKQTVMTRKKEIPKMFLKYFKCKKQHFILFKNYDF